MTVTADVPVVTKPGAKPEEDRSKYIIKEVLLGATIGFAQIPESVAFAYLANIKPPIALHAAWMVGLCCSLLGGRPGMVNGATGAFAAIIGTFLPEPVVNGGNGEGVELLFPSVILAGLIMWAISALKLSRFILLLPSPVMIGFCNGLAWVIGLAQLHPFQDSETHEFKKGMELVWMLIITVVAMLVMEFLPKIPLKIFQILPSSLIAIFSSIFIQYVLVRPLGSNTDTIGDVSEFTSDTRFPIPFFVDHVSTDYDLKKITESGAAGTIIVQGILLAVVGSIESLMTSEVVESYVGTPSDGDRTVAAMGLGNVLSGFFGGMGGNAMIGLSTINVLNGGKGRIAPSCTALLVMISIVGAYPLLNYIPVSALAGIMLVVVLHTFKWFSVGIVIAAFLPESLRKRLDSKYFRLEKKIPRSEAAVIVVVTLMSIFTNIAYAVIAGTAMCALSFSWKSGGEFEASEHTVGDLKIYRLNGPLFFVSANKLVKIMKPDTDPLKVQVHFGSSVMDFSGMEVMSKMAAKYKSHGKVLTFHNLNKQSTRLIEKGKALVQEFEYNAGPALAVAPADVAVADAAAKVAAAPVETTAAEVIAVTDVEVGPVGDSTNPAPDPADVTAPGPENVVDEEAGTI